MSGSSSKKFRKQVKKTVKENFGEGFELLSKIVRPRPRWIPKRIWILFYLPLFKKKHVGKIYETLK